MANTVAGLAVLLGLDATEYIRGLTKAEYQAKQFARNTKTAINEVEKEIAKLGIAALILDRTKAIISEAAALNDLADATGSTVESLSRLNNQVKISGGDINSMNDAVLKLAAGMSGADSKGSKVNETLKLLGITAKDPVEALQQVALKLNTYADGVNKVGLAQALFGKSGREFLKTLQDVAELQDVQATVTAKQAKAAEDLEKSWRALAVTATTFSDAVLSNLVPALERLLRLTQQSGGAGLFAAMGITPEDIANPREALKQTADDLVDLKRKLDAFTNQGVVIKLFSADDIAILNQQIKTAEARQNELRRLVNAQFISREQRPDAPKPPAGGGGGGGSRTRALKEATDEGLRYQQSLEKQLQATLNLSHEEEARVAIFDALRKGQAGFSAEVQANILDMARQLDTTEALKKAEQERKKSQEQIQQATNNAVKSAMQQAESTREGNEQLQEQIVFLRGGQEAVDRMAAAKLADAIASKEAELATLKYLEASQLLIDATAEQIRQLRDRQVLVADRKAAQEAADEAKLAKQYADELGAALAQGAENAILHFNNLRDVLKSVEQDLLRIITRKLVTQPLGNFFSDLIGAGISGFGGSSFGMNVRASGGPVAAGEPYMVGERGPELFIPKQSGTVVANSQMGRSFVFNINVPAGATRSTIDQTRVKFGLELQNALDRGS